MKFSEQFSIAFLVVVALVPQYGWGQAPPGFSLNTGFPRCAGIANRDGGMFVNLDDDPELEYVAAANPFPISELYAWNSDGSEVEGWPVELGDGTFGAPAFGDIDGDGEEEIIAQTFFFGISSEVFAIRKNGDVMPGFPVAIGGSFRSPSLADIDGDDDLDIVTSGNLGGSGLVYAIDESGQNIPGWPQPFPMTNEIVSGMTPATADVDRDGDVEIFVASFYRLYGFNSDGSLLDGFPWEPPDSTHAFNSYSSPSLADIDNDGELEIVVTTSIEIQGANNTAPQIHVLNHDGSPVSGWPQDLPTPYIQSGGATTINTPVSVADIDNDGGLDIVVSDVTLCPDPCNVLMAWDGQGNPKPGFPVGPLPANQVQIMMADIDNDGFVELFTDNNLAANPNNVFNHDGTPVVGWELEFLDGSGQPDFADINGDGFMNFMLPVNNPVAGVETVDFYLYSSTTVPFDKALAPVSTYQYNYLRNGQIGFSKQPGLLGDLNCDGVFDLLDVVPFVLAITSATSDPPFAEYLAEYPDCDPFLADFDGNGLVDLLDVTPFDALIGG